MTVSRTPSQQGGGGGAVTAERFYAIDANVARNTYQVREVGSAGSYQMTWRAPFDLADFTGAGLGVFVIGFAPGAGAVGAGKNIQLTNEYGAVGESSQLNNETDLAATFTVPANPVLFAFDVTGVFSGVAAGDWGGLAFTHNTIGGTLAYLGLLFRYNVS